MVWVYGDVGIVLFLYVVGIWFFRYSVFLVCCLFILLSAYGVFCIWRSRYMVWVYGFVGVWFCRYMMGVYGVGIWCF